MRANLIESQDFSTTERTSTALSALPEDRVFRVALYNETNSTRPTYASGVMNTNYTMLYNILDGAGYEVTRITHSDVENYELVPENYDVLVLADNCPRENMTDQFKEFWLGGGGILSIDSSASYLGYSGILPRENESVSDGFGDFWSYPFNNVSVIAASHPVTKSYEIGDELTYLFSDFAAYYWDALMTTTIADDLTKLSYDDDNANYVNALAMDPSDKGGKVVQIGIPINPWPSDWEEMLIDTIDWLTPRPKARVAYDLSHRPQLGIDPWDTHIAVYDAGESYTELRDAYVNHSYTFDKLYPSAEGNFTADRLANFDLIVLAWPNLNLTVSERTALLDWIDMGGSLFALADRSGFMSSGAGYLIINWTIQDMDISVGGYNIQDDVSATLSEPRHPTTEDCGSIQVSYRNYLNVTGPAADPIYDYEGNIVLASQQYGAGRVVVSSDLNIFTNIRVISTPSNERLSVNIADWLTASEADILYMCNYPVMGDAFAYPHNSPGALALNELGLEYQVVYSGNWLNESLHWYDWEFAIVDSVWPLGNYYDDLVDYVETGSYLLMSFYWTRTETDERLWPLLGFEASSTGVLTPDSTYIYDEDHPIFNIPIDYGADNISGGLDFGTTGEELVVFDNATALAGYNESVDSTRASIVLRNDRRTLYNGYLIDQYVEDTDGSGYADNYEMWLNQIAFMSAAWIDQPADFTYEAATADVDIVWDAESHAPATYEVTVNGTVADSDIWDGSSITFAFGGYDPDVYEIVLNCTDEFGISSTDVVIATVVDTTSPTLNEPFDFEINEGQTAEIEWTGDDPYPDQYRVYVNGTEIQSGAWAGGDLTISLANLEIGVHNVTLWVVDEYGNDATDTVWVTVNESTSILDLLDTQTLLLIAIGVLVLIIIVIVARRRK
jgi:hypothetical protein